MGVHVLVGLLEGSKKCAVLVDSVTGTAFGPVIDDSHPEMDPEDRAEAFLAHLAAIGNKDARRYTDAELHAIYNAWAIAYVGPSSGTPAEGVEADNPDLRKHWLTVDGRRIAVNTWPLTTGFSFDWTYGKGSGTGSVLGTRTDALVEATESIRKWIEHADRLHEEKVHGCSACEVET